QDGGSGDEAVTDGAAGVEPDGGEGKSGEADGDGDENRREAEFSLFEDAQGGGGGVGRELLKRAAAAGGDKFEGPRADGETRGAEGGRARPVGDGAGGNGKPRRQHDAQQVAEQEIQHLGRVEGSAVE